MWTNYNMIMTHISLKGPLNVPNVSEAKSLHKHENKSGLQISKWKNNMNDHLI